MDASLPIPKSTPSPNGRRKLAKHVWIWIVILTTIVGLWPIDYPTTRVALVAGLVLTWTGALALWWKKRAIWMALVLVGALPVAALCLPGRDPDPEGLAEDYCRGLRLFRGVRYAWGGEGFLGIDCSGLVRKGLVWGHICNGLRTCNGTPIRRAISIWWHDSSARALRDGYRGWTVQTFRHDSIAAADPGRLKPGDLAVTANGAHIMAYLGQNTWIEADPSVHKVLEVVLPTDNHWFKTPVVFLRWKWLDSPPSTNPMVGRR